MVAQVWWIDIPPDGEGIVFHSLVARRFGMPMKGITLFIRNASQGSYQRILMRKAFEGETVRQFMKPDPVTVPHDATVRELVEDYIYRHHFKMFPVVMGDELLGCVSTGEVKRVDRSQWGETTMGEITVPCSRSNTVAPQDDIVKALSIITAPATAGCWCWKKGDWPG